LLGAEGKKRLVPLGAAACACVLAFAPSGSAGGPSSLAAAKADDAAVAARSRAAVLDLYSLAAQVDTAERRLDALRVATERLTQQRAALTRELRLARVDTRLSQDRLATRLRFLYEHGSTSSLDVLMGAKSLQDAMTTLDEYNRVARANALVLVQLETATHHLRALQRTIASRSRMLAATTAAAAQTVAQLQQLRAGRMAYISSLESRRSLDAATIARLTAEAQAAAARSQALAVAQARTVAAPAAAPSPPPAPVAVVTGGRTLTVSATGYDLPGHTSSGLPVGWGIAAVDPSVIPLGTRFVVPGYGVAVAADTGGAIVGSTIDLWFPSANQAYAWGRRTVTITIDQS